MFGDSIDSFIQSHPIITVFLVFAFLFLVFLIKPFADIVKKFQDQWSEYIYRKVLKGWTDALQEIQNKDAEQFKEDITIEKKVVIKTESGEIIEKQKEIDALGLMQHNLTDIKTYYTWSQKQAKDSFGFAKLMSIAGFTLMALAIVLLAVFKKPIEVALISAASGAITELLAATVMIVYRNSMEQLNHYHHALHEDERFLSSINLVEKFKSTDLRDVTDIPFCREIAGVFCH